MYRLILLIFIAFAGGSPLNAQLTPGASLASHIVTYYPETQRASLFFKIGLWNVEGEYYPSITEYTQGKIFSSFQVTSTLEEDFTETYFDSHIQQIDKSGQFGNTIRMTALSLARYNKEKKIIERWFFDSEGEMTLMTGYYNTKDHITYLRWQVKDKKASEVIDRMSKEEWLDSNKIIWHVYEKLASQTEWKLIAKGNTSRAQDINN